MQLNKKILVMVLGLLPHELVIGMEIDVKDFQQQPLFSISRTSKLEAEKLAYFARVNSNSAMGPEVIKWLVFNRNAIVENEPWMAFVDEFVSNMERIYCSCDCLEKKRLATVIQVVKEMLHELQPGQDCSQLLVDRAQEEILKIGQ